MKFGDAVYAEYVGVNLSIFLKNLAEKIPKFLEYNDRYESNLKLRMRLFLLGSDLESVNSIKIASNYVSVMKKLDQKDDLKIAKTIIESKIQLDNVPRASRNVGIEEKTVFESEMEKFKILLN